MLLPRKAYLEFPVDLPAELGEDGEVERPKVLIVAFVEERLVDGEEVGFQRGRGLPATSGEEETIRDQRHRARKNLIIRRRRRRRAFRRRRRFPLRRRRRRRRRAESRRSHQLRHPR